MTDTVRYLETAPPDDDDRSDPTPHDHNAEAAVLGAILRDPTQLDDATTTVTADDFWRPAHRLIFEAAVALYSRTRPVDTTTVANQLGKDLPKAGGRATLEQLTLDAIAVADVSYYADIVRDQAQLRRLKEHHERGLQDLAIRGDTTPAELYQRTAEHLAAIPRGVPGVDETMPGLTIDELLDTEDPEYDWLIPGFLERRDRLILTGAEGAGKSTLIRQIGIQAAAGIHPWSLDTVNPVRVLFIDLENSQTQNRRAYRSLRFVAGDALANGQMIVHSKLDGLDLTDPHDEAWLDRMVTYHQPDLLITGPIYKLAGGNPNDEKDAKPAALALDRIRDRHGVALILEAHSRKGESTNPKHRPKEPYGWSGWMRWPEFGFHIDTDGDLSTWRGKRDRDREFPTHLKQGGSWPWNPIVTLADQQWLKIRREAEDAGGRISQRELARRLGLSESTLRGQVAGREMELEAIYSRAETDRG